jgi:hypothetical protein
VLFHLFHNAPQSSPSIHVRYSAARSELGKISIITIANARHSINRRQPATTAKRNEHVASFGCFGSAVALSARAYCSGANRTLSGSERPNAWSNRVNSSAAKSECPAKSKKLTSMPTGSTPNVSAHTCATYCSSRSRRGYVRRFQVCPRISGSGKTFRSTLPLGVRDIASSRADADGIV